jgi:hypothetical protein
VTGEDSNGLTGAGTLSSSSFSSGSLSTRSRSDHRAIPSPGKASKTGKHTVMLAKRSCRNIHREATIMYNYHVQTSQIVL